jgi:hypothetical protein
VDVHTRLRIAKAAVPLNDIQILLDLLTSLRKTIASHDPAEVAVLFDYVLYPLNEIFDFDPGFTTRRDTVYLHVFQSLSVLVNCYAVAPILSTKSLTFAQPGLFASIFNRLLRFIAPPGELKDQTLAYSEDTRLVAVQTLDCLCRIIQSSSPQNVAIRLYLSSPSYRIPLGYATSMLLAIATQDRLRELRCAALGLLARLLQLYLPFELSPSADPAPSPHEPLPAPERESEPEDEDEVRAHASDVVLLEWRPIANGNGELPPALVGSGGAAFACFLPGLLSALASLIAGDAHYTRPGARVLTAAVDAWTMALLLVATDCPPRLSFQRPLQATANASLPHSVAAPPASPAQARAAHFARRTFRAPTQSRITQTYRSRLT